MRALFDKQARQEEKDIFEERRDSIVFFEVGGGASSAISGEGRNWIIIILKNSGMDITILTFLVIHCLISSGCYCFSHHYVVWGG